MRKGASFAVAATGAALLSGALLSGCSGDDGPSQAPLARVDVVTAKVVDFAPRVTLTGTIQAQVQNDLSFRLSGKIIERSVDVGDHVTADQVLARLDPRTQKADVESAKAGVQLAEAQLKQATATYQRQKALIDAGFTTRTAFDQAEQSLRTAQASLDSANNQRKSAENQLSYTILKAGQTGVITARFAEVGQVVEQARAIFSIAKDGPRDAVFDVYEAIFAQVPDDAIRNSVILITQIDDFKEKGLAPWDAVVEATRHRMRPILLTAAAASLGMIPIAREVFWGPMAYAMIGGIIVGTVLTLVFLPALYVAWYRIEAPDERTEAARV